MIDEKEEVVPFADVLDAVFTAEYVSIPLLYRFSDMSAEDTAQFHARWQDVDEQRRHEIVRHWADLTEENFVVDFSPLFVHCFADTYEYVREAALDGIWDTTEIRLVDAIIGMMQADESLIVRASAARALAHYVLLSEWGQLPRQVSPKIIEALLLEYDKPETSVPVRRAALEALSAANHPRVASLVEAAYEDLDLAMQLSAVFAMGNSADKRWAAIVLAEMENENDDMRAEAARAAGVIGGSNAIPQLAELSADADLGVQTAAIYALGQIGGETAESVLASLLDDPEFVEVHETVEEALEEMALLSGDLELFDYLDDHSE